MSKEIMICCAHGMSSSLIAEKVQKAAEAKGLDADVFAVPRSEAPDKLKEKKIDAILLGPSLRFQKPKLEEAVKDSGQSTGIDVIDMQAYGMLNGEKILAQAEKVMGE